MAVNKDNNMEEDDIPVGVQKVFDERHYRNIERNVRKSQPKLYRAAVIAGAIAMVLAYFCMPVSRVNAVTVSGNSILGDDYIQNLADVDQNSIYFLTIPFLVERRIESDVMIDDARVTLEQDNAVRIQVTEKKLLGYRYDDEALLVFTDGTTTPLKSEFLDVISKVPMIIGFDEPELLRKMAKSFADVDEAIIRDISEISQYSLSYDPECIRVLMRSGGYFMGNYYNMSMLNQYWTIYNHQKDKSQCIFADDSLLSAYSKACPWDEPQVEKEYWTDSDGNIMTNTYGDYVEKHYYTNADGSFALDKQGRKIPIPVNKQGYDSPDPEFAAHYEAGYYDEGVLKIPEEKDEEKKDDEKKDEENPDASANPEESSDTQTQDSNEQNTDDPSADENDGEDEQQTQP